MGTIKDFKLVFSTSFAYLNEKDNLNTDISYNWRQEKGQAEEVALDNTDHSA